MTKTSIDAETLEESPGRNKSEKPGFYSDGFFGLRARLLFGLALVALALVGSVGFVALWAVERSLRVEQDLHAALLADGASHVLSATLKEGEYNLLDSALRGAVERSFSNLSLQGGFVELAVKDSRGTVLRFGDIRETPGPGDDPFFRLVERVPEVPMKRMSRDDGHPRGPGVDFVFYRRIRGGRNWVVMRFVFSADAAVETLMNRARTAVWLLAVINGVLLLLLAGVFLTRSIINPIRRLEKAARRVAGGELDVDVVEGGTGEIGRLGKAFNEMTARLRENKKTMESQIVQLKSKQEELDESWKQLMKAEKFASVGRLAAGVAHEVGNPLTAVVGYADMLQDDALSEEERKEFLSLMERELKRVDSTIRGLLDYSRRDRSPIQPRNPKELICRAARLVAHQKRFKGLDIRIQLPHNLPDVMVSESALEGVMVNLFLNAADAIGGKGQITVEGRVVVERGPESGEDRGSSEGDDKAGQVEILVSDTGTGVSEDIRGKIFDPFFTTKDVGEGTGLGLAISGSLMETMGGSLELASAGGDEGKGASFRILLKKA